MQIEKNVPIPPKMSKTLHGQMEIGDSIYLTGERMTTQHNTIRTYGWRTGKRFSVRSDDNGMRVWRIS